MHELFKLCLRIVFFVCISTYGVAYDYSYTAGARLYPKSAGIGGTLGFSQPIWGEKKENEMAYGYWRPYFRGATSITVNQLEAGFDFFPISILGISFSHLVSHRSKDFDDMPCATSSCQGLVSTTSAKSHLILGYQNLFVVWETQLSWAKLDTNITTFIDENTMLKNISTGNHYLVNEIIAGYVLDPKYTLGINVYETTIAESKNYNWQASAWVSYKKNKDMSMVLGAGHYGSTLQPRDFTAYALLKWNGGYSLSLIP